MGGASGRGSPNKAPFTGALSRSENNHPSGLCLGKVKGSLHGCYHQVCGKHQGRYLAEFCYRFNRRLDLAAMLPRLGRAALNTPPMPHRPLVLAVSS
jgi:hypothetical protein